MMRKQIFFLILYVCVCLSAYSSPDFKQTISVENNITIPIDDLFVGERLSCQGKQSLLGLKENLVDNDIYIECFTNRKYCYNASWELADIYAYNIVIFLIKNGIKPEKITYIGYGNMSAEDKEPNRIVFSLSK